MHWTVFQGFVPDEALLVCNSGSSQYHLNEDLESSATSVTVNTNGYPEPDSWTSVFISVDDEYGRWFNMGWSF